MAPGCMQHQHENRLVPARYAISAQNSADTTATPSCLDLIAEHYDDLLRLAGSLKFGHVTASLLVGKLSVSGRQNALTSGIPNRTGVAILSLMPALTSSLVMPTTVVCMICTMSSTWSVKVLVMVSRRYGAPRHREKQYRSGGWSLHPIRARFVP